MFRPSVPDEERLHVRVRIFWLLEHDMFHTQHQLCDVLHWHMEFCQDREDYVDVHRDRLFSLSVILITQVAVTQVLVAVTQLRVAFPSGWGNLAHLLAAAVIAATTFVLG
jgi:hypothetical protein